MTIIKEKEKKKEKKKERKKEKKKHLFYKTWWTQILCITTLFASW